VEQFLLGSKNFIHPNIRYLDYKRIEDIRGECDTLYKKSMIARLRGDVALADEWAGRYLTLFNAHMIVLSDDEDIPEGNDPEDTGI
jgi:hypothetical protein